MHITRPCPQRSQFNQPDMITGNLNFNNPFRFDLGGLQSTLRKRTGLRGKCQIPQPGIKVPCKKAPELPLQGMDGLSYKNSSLGINLIFCSLNKPMFSPSSLTENVHFSPFLLAQLKHHTSQFSQDCNNFCCLILQYHTVCPKSLFKLVLLTFQLVLSYNKG